MQCSEEPTPLTSTEMGGTVQLLISVLDKKQPQLTGDAGWQTSPAGLCFCGEKERTSTPSEDQRREKSCVPGHHSFSWMHG